MAWVCLITKIPRKLYETFDKMKSYCAKLTQQRLTCKAFLPLVLIPEKRLYRKKKALFFPTRRAFALPLEFHFMVKEFLSTSSLKTATSPLR